MILIDGKTTAATIRKEISQQAMQIYNQRGYRPHLAAILVGHDGGSETYVAHKVKDCEEVGFDSSLIRFEDNVSEMNSCKKLTNSMLIPMSMALLFSFLYLRISMSKRLFRLSTIVKM